MEITETTVMVHNVRYYGPTFKGDDEAVVATIFQDSCPEDTRELHVPKHLIGQFLTAARFGEVVMCQDDEGNVCEFKEY